MSRLDEQGIEYAKQITQQMEDGEGPLNAAHIYILDASGQTHCDAFMVNVYRTIESHKAHCRWYLGRRATGVCKPARIVVEFYHDDSAAKVDKRMGR